jgi:hypothetical protein
MSTTDRKLLINVQQFSLDRIMSHDALTTVAAILERRAVTEAAAQQMLSVRNVRGGKVGLCIIVMRPTFVPNQDDQSLRGIVYQDLLVLEHPTINEGNQGTRITAEACALELFQLFAYAPMGNNSKQCYAAAPGGAVVPDDTFDGFNAWRVRLQVAAACPRDLRCGLPLIAPDSGAAPQEITLTSATPGATILYTLDGSYPRNGNPSALAYSAPFTVAEACTLLAAAQKDGLQQSGLAEATFT